MIVIDTSVWADHINTPLPAVNEYLANDEVLQHPFVTGELALGNLRSRQTTIRFLESIDAAPVSSDGHLLEFIADNDLGGTGIGFVDAHLLVSAALAEARLWTHDKRLAAQAGRLGLMFQP